MDKRELLVGEIERSAIHDGDGIRTVVFLQGCPLSCPWCCNPETQPISPTLLHDFARCVGCGACKEACPNGAIAIVGGKARIDRAGCKACGACLNACPLGLNKLSSRRMTIDEILDIVLRDVAYYRATGGGLTLSGGEPLLQTNALALLMRAKAAGLHIAVETTANVPTESLLSAVVHADQFLVDYKHPDADALRRKTGALLAMIERNIRALVNAGANVTLRTPVIPGFNDDADTMARCFGFARSLGLTKYALLAYHALGESKYQKLDRVYAMQNMRTQTPQSLAALAALGEGMGLNVRIGG